MGDDDEVKERVRKYRKCNNLRSAAAACRQQGEFDEIAGDIYSCIEEMRRWQAAAAGGGST